MDGPALAAGWVRLKGGTLWHSAGRCKGFADANPGEAAALDAYVAALAAGGTPPMPNLATPTGDGLARMIAAGVLAPAPTPVPTPTPTPVPTPSDRWFPDTAYMNVKVPADPALDPLNGQYQGVIRTSPFVWANGLSNSSGAWSVPVYRSDASTPRITVSLTVPYKGAGSVTFPCAPGWKTSPESDAHLVVIEPDGTYWEFQGLDLVNKVAHSVAKGNIVTGDGVPTAADAIAPLPTVAGLIRPSEIAAGVIPHALRIAAPWTQHRDSGQARWPAWWSDGGNPQGPPCGAQLWLPRNADLSSLTTPAQKIVCTAWQEYAAHLSDASGSLAVYFESTADGSAYPFTALSLPAQIVAQLVVLAPVPGQRA